MRGMDWDRRAKEFASLYQGGMTLQQIGQQFGISGEAVRASMAKRGLNQVKGSALRKAKRLKAVADARDNRCLEKRGCTWAQYKQVPRSAKTAFRDQERNARHRGVPWRLKFWEWWQIWQCSGVMGKRGRNLGQYVMCRVGDQGAYEVGNVYIATNSHNCSAAQLRKWHGQDIAYPQIASASY